MLFWLGEDGDARRETRGHGQSPCQIIAYVVGWATSDLSRGRVTGKHSLTSSPQATVTISTPTLCTQQKRILNVLRRHGQGTKPPLVIGRPVGFLSKSYTGLRAPSNPPPLLACNFPPPPTQLQVDNKVCMKARIEVCC